MIYNGTVVRASAGPAFTVPTRLIAKHLTTVEYNGISPEPPRLTAFWVRSFVYERDAVGSAVTATEAIAPDVPDFVASRQQVAGATPYEWWRHHRIPFTLLAFLFYLLLGAGILWSAREIWAFARRRSLLLGVPLSALCLLAAITTNFDVQLFKGLGERFWLYGPLPALTLTGYGPIVDTLFSIPMVPYLVLADILGRESEFALNFAFRLPFIIGWLLMMAACARLLGMMPITKQQQRIAWLLIALSPNVFIWNLWQPEALIVGFAVLALYSLMQGRMVAGGVFYGLSVCGKYWPLFMGPILLIYAWKTFGRRAAVTWLASGIGITAGLMVGYWAPTLVSLGSPRRFLELVQDRSPYFGGSTGASFATVWSLYSLPKQILNDGARQLVTELEKVSFILVICVFAATAVAAALSPMGRRRLVLLIATVLAAAVGLNSLSVAGFAAWSLPFLVAGAIGYRRGAIALVVAGGAWVAGALVTIVIEPITFWLQNTSPQLDRIAQVSAIWSQEHIVNPRLAQWLGFAFCAGLTLVAVLTGWLASVVSDESACLPGETPSATDGVAHIPAVVADE